MAEKKKGAWQQSPFGQDLFQYDGQIALLQAAKCGKAKEVRLLLGKNSVDSNVKDRHGRTALSYAAEHGHEEVVKLLMEEGSANPNIEDGDGQKPLLWTLEKQKPFGASFELSARRYAVAKLLLESGKVIPDCQDSKGRTALSYAAERGNSRLVDLLLNHNPDSPKLLDNAGRTPLSLAAERGHEEVAELLIKKGNADPNLKDKEGGTPLLRAINGLGVSVPFDKFHRKRNAVAQLLLKHKEIKLNHQDSKGRTALSYAAEHGNTDLVNLLLKQDSVIADSEDDYGRTPLSRAAEKGQKEVIEILIEQGSADPEFKDKAGRTPLSWAVLYPGDSYHFWKPENKDYGAMKLLLSQENVNPDSPDNEGQTPLSWAIEHLRPLRPLNNTNLRVLDLLLEQNRISLESKDIYGRTPLSRAARCGQKVVMKRLLEQDGVNPDVKDDDGRTPLSQAAEHGWSTVVDLLLEQSSVDANSRDNYDRTPLWWAAKAGHEAIIQALVLSDGVDPEPMDKDGQTPLSCAIENGHVERVKILIERDETTLHILAQKGSLNTLQVLVKGGYDTNIKDIRGRTPLHAAALSGHVHIAKELIGGQADVNYKDTNGMTPLRVAIQHRQQNLIHLLLKHSAQIKEIISSEWLEAFNCTGADVVLELSQKSCGSKSLQFVQAQLIQMASEPGPTKRLSCFADYYTWSSCLGCNPKDFFELDKSRIFYEVQVHGNHVCIFLIGAFPSEQQSGSGEQSAISQWSKYGIAWKMVPPSTPKDGSSWKSIDHFSMLPYGWIPDDGADFFVLFIRKLKENWLILCVSAEERLSQRRLDQLCAKGNTIELIHYLAEDAQEWAKLRTTLRNQVRAARYLAAEYCRAYDQDEGSRTMQSAIDQFAAEVNEQISLLDRTVKELLQFEFAWVSINEAHRSTSIATSIKRLSWITFIFLPAMFASSLFGMNVDILASSPDWRWYLLFGGGCLTLTVLVWLLFKYGQVETLIERYLGKKNSTTK